MKQLNIYLNDNDLVILDKLANYPLKSIQDSMIISKEQFIDEIKKINAKVIKVEIEANSKNINNIVGHKKENLEKLKDTYALIATAKENDEIKEGKFKVNVLETA